MHEEEGVLRHELLKRRREAGRRSPAEGVEEVAPSRETGLRPTRGPSLTTQWSRFPDVGTRYLVPLISAGADDALWMADFNKDATMSLHLFDANLGDWTRVVEVGWALSLAALSLKKAVAVVAESPDANARRWVSAMGSDGTTRRLPALPNDAVARSVAAADDGTLWVIDTVGRVHSYLDENNAWVTIDTKGLAIESLSIGSVDNIWAAGTRSGGPIVCRYSTTEGWVEVSEVTELSPAWLAAGADGSVWLRRASMLILKPPEKGWEEMQLFPLRNGTDPAALAAGSRFHLYCLDAAGFRCLSVGVAEQPAVDWPAQSDSEAAAYRYVSDRVAGPDTGGIRNRYDDALAPFSEWIVAIRNMKAPDDIDSESFETLRAQLVTELQYVITIYPLFDKLERLTSAMQILNVNSLAAMAALAGIETHSKEARTSVNVVLLRMFETGINMIIWQVPNPYRSGVQLVIAGMRAAVEHHPDTKPPDYSLPARYVDLAKKLNALFIEILTEHAELEQKLLTDWGRLKTAGELIARGVWRWPVMDTPALVKASEKAFRLAFLQSLVPAKWKIVFLCYYMFKNRGDCPNRSVPKWARYHEEGRRPDAPTWDVENWYICNHVEATRDYNAKDMGPFPGEKLFHELDELDTSRAHFFRGEGGWALRAVPNKGGSAPRPCRTPADS